MRMIHFVAAASTPRRRDAESAGRLTCGRSTRRRRDYDVDRPTRRPDKAPAAYDPRRAPQLPTRPGSRYIEFCADRLLLALGAPKLYESQNPYDWMELISLQGKTNFFEKRVGEYAKSNVGVAQEEAAFSTDLDF